MIFPCLYFFAIFASLIIEDILLLIYILLITSTFDPNIVKVSLHPNVTFRLNVVMFKIPTGFFAVIDKLILKFMRKCRWTRRVKFQKQK